MGRQLVQIEKQQMPMWRNLQTQEKSLPGYKPMKDRLTLLLCANASGDCKIRLPLLYYFENPLTFKLSKVIKGKLSVLWRINRKALVTRLTFMEWFNLVFVPAIKKYLEDNMPLKDMLWSRFSK